MRRFLFGIFKLRGKLGKTLEVSNDGEALVRIQPQKLFDEHFLDSALNSGIWEEITANNGSITVQDTFCNLSCTSTNGDVTEITTKITFLHTFSQTILFKSGVVLDQESLNNNIRSWGMHNHDTHDGWFFYLENGILCACTEFDGVLTKTNIDSYKPVDGNVHRYDAVYRNYRIEFYIDQVLVHISLATLAPLYQEERLHFHFRNENTGATSASVLKIEGCSLFDTAASGTQISGADIDGIVREVKTSKEGRLLTESTTAEAPANKIPVDAGGQVTVTKQGGTNSFNYVIPTNETFALKRFELGGYIPKDGIYNFVVKGELWYQPNGSATGEILIKTQYLQHKSDGSTDFGKEYVGDGTKRFQIRLTNWSVEDTEIERWIRGYY